MDFDGLEIPTSFAVMSGYSSMAAYFSMAMMVLAIGSGQALIVEVDGYYYSVSILFHSLGTPVSSPTMTSSIALKL